MLARTIVTEQTYRAQEIARGGHYHHAWIFTSWYISSITRNVV
jgi:hypothetical protein